MTKEYLGYYTSDKISSKKGMQGTTAYTEDMAVQHVLLNVDLADMVSTTPRSGYVPYTYKGTTYYFQDMIALVQTMRYLNGWDNDNPYGNHRRSITLGTADELERRTLLSDSSVSQEKRRGILLCSEYAGGKRAKYI